MIRLDKDVCSDLTWSIASYLICLQSLSLFFQGKGRHLLECIILARHVVPTCALFFIKKICLLVRYSSCCFFQPVSRTPMEYYTTTRSYARMMHGTRAGPLSLNTCQTSRIYTCFPLLIDELVMHASSSNTILKHHSFFFFIFLNTQLYVYKLASYWETMRCSRRVQLACHVPTSGHDGMVLNNHHHQLWAVAGIHPSISDDHGSACNVKGRPAERICMHACIPVHALMACIHTGVWSERATTVHYWPVRCQHSTLKIWILLAAGGHCKARED